MKKVMSGRQLFPRGQVKNAAAAHIAAEDTKEGCIFMHKRIRFLKRLLRKGGGEDENDCCGQ